MLLAVLEKRCGFKLGHKDVFLNIAGGIKADDPAIDLAVVAAVLSSNQDIFIDPKTCFAAEVGLSGEIRPINRVEQRISEADKLGGVKTKTFRRAIQSKQLKYKIVKNRYSIDLSSLLSFLHAKTKLKNKLSTYGLGQYIREWYQN